MSNQNVNAAAKGPGIKWFKPLAGILLVVALCGLFYRQCGGKSWLLSKSAPKHRMTEDEKRDLVNENGDFIDKMMYPLFGTATTRVFGAYGETRSLYELFMDAVDARIKPVEQLAKESKSRNDSQDVSILAQQTVQAQANDHFARNDGQIAALNRRLSGMERSMPPCDPNVFNHTCDGVLINGYQTTLTQVSGERNPHQARCRYYPENPELTVRTTTLPCLLFLNNGTCPGRGTSMSDDWHCPAGNYTLTGTAPPPAARIGNTGTAPPPAPMGPSVGVIMPAPSQAQVTVLPPAGLQPLTLTVGDPTVVRWTGLAAASVVKVKACSLAGTQPGATCAPVEVPISGVQVTLNVENGDPFYIEFLDNAGNSVIQTTVIADVRTFNIDLYNGTGDPLPMSQCSNSGCQFRF